MAGTAPDRPPGAPRPARAEAGPPGRLGGRPGRLGLGDDPVLHLRWSLVVVRELHVELALAPGDAGQGARVLQHFGHRDLRLNDLRRAPGFAREHPPAARGDVTADVADDV